MNFGLRKRMLAAVLTVCMAGGSILQGMGNTQIQAAETDVTDGLVGYWTFEGDTETEALASKAEITNITAQKTGTGVAVNDGAGVGKTAAAVFGGNNNSYLTLDLNGGSQGLSASGAFTIGAWIKYDTLAQGNTSVFHQDGSNTGRAILTIGNNGKYGTYLDGNNRYGSGTVQTGEWHHVMLAVDAGNASPRKAYFYLDGVQTNAETLTGNLVDGSGNIRVGAHRQNADNSAISGAIDEIRYYNKAVSAETVKAIYDQYSGSMELQKAKERLDQLIARAKSLGAQGNETDAEALLQAIARAEEIRDSVSADKAAVEDMITELQAAVTQYEAGMPISILADPGTIVREIPSAMFGINHRYHNLGYGTWEKEQNKMNDAFNTLAKEANFGSVRYPGGTVSNLFTWKDTIGEDRTTTIAGNNFYSDAGEVPVDPAFGVDEAMKWIYDDLNAEAIFVYGLGRGNPQDAADLVEYLNAPNDGSNPNGGTDWAAVRAANGHEEPYGVIRFELGNEFSDTGQNYWMSGISENNKGTVDLYIDGDRMTISGQRSYYQTNNRVAKKGDWRPSASLSDGNPNEERYVYYLPVVEGSAEVFVAGAKWEIVESLEGKGAENVCTFDYETGKIAFGDGTDGNIPAQGAEITCNYKTDQAGFVEYYEAMKAVDSEIELYSGIVDRLQNDFIDKMNAKGYNDKYDGVIIHPYSSGVTSYQDSLVRAKTFSNNIATYKNKMYTVTEDDSKKVAVSEFGILSVNPASNYQTSLGHAIYIANHMIDCVNSGAAYQNKHCLVDTTSVSDNLGAWQQCVIQCYEGNDGNQFVATPSAHLFSIFNQMTGDHQVSETIIGNDVFTGSGATAVNNINVYSTKDDEGNTYVMVVNNKEDNAATVDISVIDQNLKGKTVKIWSMTSESVTDMNTLAEPDNITVEKTKKTAEGSSFVYTLAPHSVYSFKIQKYVDSDMIVESGNQTEGSVTGIPEQVETGDVVTITATPEEGYEFIGWYIEGQDAPISIDPNYTFTVGEITSALKAQFALKYGITVTAGAGGTAVSSVSEAIAGTMVTVTAAPSEGYGFAGWYIEGQDEPVSADSSYTFTIGSSDVALEARFALKYGITVTAGAGGTAVSSVDEAIAGTMVTVTATPSAGYDFAGWYEGSVQISKSAVYTFQIQKNTALIAKFTIKQTAPAVPTGVKAKKTKKGIQISWKKADGAEGYIIYRSYKKKKGYKKIAEIKKAGTKKYLDKKAKKGKTAYYKIKSYKTINGKQVLSSTFSKVVKKKR